MATGRSGRGRALRSTGDTAAGGPNRLYGVTLAAGIGVAVGAVALALWYSTSASWTGIYATHNPNPGDRLSLKLDSTLFWYPVVLGVVYAAAALAGDRVTWWALKPFGSKVVWVTTMSCVVISLFIVRMPQAYEYVPSTFPAHYPEFPAIYLAVVLPFAGWAASYLIVTRVRRRHSSGPPVGDSPVSR